MLEADGQNGEQQKQVEAVGNVALITWQRRNGLELHLVSHFKSVSILG